jgi:F-type H+-transporting ATPase subunit gamma
MSGLKELRVRIASVQNTKKITYAMKLVSAAKLKKSQDAVVRSRQYTDALQGLLRELVMESEGGEFSHPLMQKRADVKRVRLVVIGGNRGLCGGYNSNLHRKVESFIRELLTERPNLEIDAVILGRKPAEYYRRVRRSYSKSFEKLQEDANRWPIEEISQELEQDFVNGTIDEAYVIYTKFKSALSMKPVHEKLLPMDFDVEGLQAGQSDEFGASGAGLTIFEPSITDVFSQIIPRIMQTRVRQACLDASASEHGSRMTAMEAATKNAGDLIKKLQLTYNKARQSKITAELLDIIGGASGVK